MPRARAGAVGQALEVDPARERASRSGSAERTDRPRGPLSAGRSARSAPCSPAAAPARPACGRSPCRSGGVARRGGRGSARGRVRPAGGRGRRQNSPGAPVTRAPRARGPRARRRGTPPGPGSPRPRAAGPPAARPRRPARSSQVATGRESGRRGPGADHDAAAGEAAGAQRLAGQRGLVERAEARAGDDEHRRVEQPRHVGDRAAVVAEAHEQPTGALDEHEVAVAQFIRRRGNRRGTRGGTSGAPGRGGGRQRLVVAGEDTEVGDPGEAVHLGQIIVSARLHRLDHRDALAAGGGERRERGADDGLADARAGSGDDEDGHAAAPATIAAAIRATSSSSVT